MRTCDIWNENGIWREGGKWCLASEARSIIAEKDAEIERLRAEVAELRKPTHYWCDLNVEVAYSDIEDCLCWSDIEPGCAFGVTPLRAMPKCYYATVPDAKYSVWTDGMWTGSCDVIGPYSTKAEARENAQRITTERRAAWESEQGGGA